MAKQVAVVLSGCGVFDGSEIHEAVLTLLALDRMGAQAVCCAPDVPQAEVVNHVSRQPLADEKRRVLLESGRIARGQIKPLSQVFAAQIDAVILPGGLGAIKNLCNFSPAGGNCQVNEDLARLLCEMRSAGKPIGAMCVAPVVVAKVLGHGRCQPSGAASAKLRVMLTVGKEGELAGDIDAMGGEHVVCAANEVVVDESNKVVSTPAYMLARGLGELEAGISRLVREVLRLAQ